jgi:hypothetical protein
VVHRRASLSTSSAFYLLVFTRPLAKASGYWCLLTGYRVLSSGPSCAWTRIVAVSLACSEPAMAPRRSFCSVAAWGSFEYGQFKADSVRVSRD